MAHFVRIISTVGLLIAAFAPHCGTFAQRNLAGLDSPLPSTVTERDILRSFYSWTGGTSWTTTTNWLSEGTHCDWFGITCTTISLNGANLPEPAVEKIELSGNNLKGDLSLSILLRFPHLRIIKLDGNSLNLSPSSDIVSKHEVEVFGVDYHDAGGQAIISPCQWLDLSHNDLGDTIDLYRTFHQTYSGREVHMPGLADLYLSGTHLSGSLGEKLLVEWPNVERLNLDMNDLSDNISPLLGNLGQLRVLSLRDNRFVGALPESLGQLRKLRYLSARGNRLSGTIPVEFYNEESMPFLEHLDLSRQREDDQGLGWSNQIGLTGKLPAFNSQTNLRQLDLSFNSFGGPVPSDFLASVNPQTFDFAMLGSNALTGTVPASALVRLPPDAIFLEDNKIEELEDAICAPGRGGGVSSFGCDAILCGPGSYGPGKGRQEDASGPCRDCPNAVFWGASQCIAGNGDGRPPVSQPTVPSSLSESDILLKFYTSTGGPNWKKKYGWADAANADSTSRRMDISNHCGWFGITCSSRDTVTEIDLEFNNLAGSPPEEIFQLRDLRRLNLAKNTIEFRFEGIAGARSLTELDLRETALFSTKGISAAANWLKEVHLDSNPLKDEAIEELLDLTQLQVLSIDDCEITGSMSDNIGLLSKLVSFSASNNQITGDLPEGLADCKDLSTLRLRSNKLSGTFPVVLTKLKSLSVVDLSHQRNADGEGGIRGRVPSFSEATELSRLDLSGNMLSGDLPDDFLRSIADNTPPQFEFVDLSSNQLEGTVPEVVAQISNVYLKDNRFTGIDPAVCDSYRGTPMESFGCDAVLCSPGTYNTLGRQQSFDNPCQRCDISSGARYFGSITCVEDSGGVPPPAPRPDSSSGSSIKPTNKEILRKIYTSCDGAKWTDSTNWLKDDAPVCTYKGISCSSNGDITAISLRSNHLDGTFPSNVFDIETLTSIVLEGNSVNFSFEGIERAFSLKELDLSQTGLSSVTGIENAANLRELYLTNNNIRGSFPDEILQLYNLEKLSLAFNSLTSTLPRNFGSSLPSLRFVDLNDNSLSGDVPSSLPSGLEVILLATNKMGGTIPNIVNSLDKLMFIDLAKQDSSDGGLTGQLPSLSGLTSVKRVDFSGNALSGPIPFDFLSSVAPGDDFDYIDISGNQLTGGVPGSFSKFEVDSIYLADNKISSIDDKLCSPDLGSLQAQFGCDAVLCSPQTYNEHGRQQSRAESCDPCSSAEYFGATSCGSEGANSPTRAPTPALPPIPSLEDRDILARLYDVCGGPRWTRSDNWKSSANVCTWFGVRCSPDGRGGIVSIMLSSNNLIGTPPLELFYLPDLESLVLDSNKILFDFDGIEYAHKLNNVDLSGTGLYSVEGISKASSLKVLNLASNALEGPAPTELFQVQTLEQLTLDFNSIKGPLPSIMRSSNLELLSMASNEVTGSIPQSITSLEKLLTLRLQNNALNGTLPDALGTMRSLTFVDLSQQVRDGNPGFTGPLPPLSNLKKLRRINLNSNSLSGEIPGDFLSSVSSIFEYADLSSNKFSGSVSPDLSRIDALYLQDNFITDIDLYCSLVTSDIVQMYGCDAILCPPGTYTELGRQTSDDSVCVPCEWAQFYGVTECTRGSSGSNTKSVAGVENPPFVLPTSVDAEREILSKLYEACDGYNWHDNKNWLSTDVSFCNWKGVQCLDGGGETVQAINLGANNLNGIPPREIFDLPNLEVLGLYSNPLRNFNFDGIQKATRLKELYLDQTGLSDVVGLGSAPSLTTINLRFNSLSGSFPPDILQMKSLKSITLSHNNLEGPLPSTVAMSGLEILILSSNSFQGKLAGVAFPPKLKILDLSKNQISGSIPLSFLDTIPDSSQLDIDLSDNLLTGVVPSSLTRYDQMTLLLANNFFVGIDNTICYKNRWNDGDVGDFGCDGFLCPKGTFAPNGRQTAGNRPCQQCKNGPFWGMTDCDGVKYRARGSAAGQRTSRFAMGISVLATIFSYMYIHGNIFS